jgi:hypothetical protein
VVAGDGPAERVVLPFRSAPWQEQPGQLRLRSVRPAPRALPRPAQERANRDAGPILRFSESEVNLAVDLWPGSGADQHAVVHA